MLMVNWYATLPAAESGSGQILEPTLRTMEWTQAAGGAGSLRSDVLIIMGTLLVAVTCATLIQYLRARAKSGYGPAWQRMAHAAGVTRSDLRLLRRLALDAGLGSGGGVFLSRGCFDHVAHAAGNAVGIRRRLSRLRKQIHGDPPGQPRT